MNVDLDQRAVSDGFEAVNLAGLDDENVSSATFNPETFCWHLPIYLAYGSTGPLGIVGDVYLHAGTGAFIGAPEATDLQRRAEALAATYGIQE